MIIQLSQVLNTQQLTAINTLIDQGQFEDGKKTAGWHAKQVKNNQQWQATDLLTKELNQKLSSALGGHPEFASATYPKYMQPFMVSESSDGAHYGNHVDDALMGNDSILRTDISCTIFLSDPDSYTGGDLTMDLYGESLSFKLAAGNALLYPSTSLHRVTPVTKGCRRVALTWIESYIRETSQREILHDLDCARKDILATSGKTASFDQVSKSHANLLRRWALT